MKKQIIPAIFALIVSIHSSSLANVVIVDSYVILNSVSENVTNSGQFYYDAKRDSGPVNPNFTGSLGTFNTASFPVTEGSTTYAPGSILQLKGAEIKTESTNGDYQNANNFARMFYAVTLASVNPTSFTQFDLGYRGEQPYPINKWDTTGVTVNLLSGLTSSGTYKLTVYFESNGSWNNNGTQQFFDIAPDNNGGSNYSMTFNVVPEPSSASLIALGTAGLLALRRRRSV